MIYDKVESFCPGTSVLVASESTDRSAAVVFEDDGETAYFYACAALGGAVHHALQIYDVAQVTDRHRPSIFKIGWSKSGRQALLLINERPHAILDFDQKKGWCLSGSAKSHGGWSRGDHEWVEACMESFR